MPRVSVSRSQKWMIQINLKEKQKELIMLFDWNWCPWKVEHLREFLEWVTWQSCHYYRDITRYRQGNEHLSCLGPFVLELYLWLGKSNIDFWLLKSVPPLYVSECIWPACWVRARNDTLSLYKVHWLTSKTHLTTFFYLVLSSELPNTAALLDWIAMYMVTHVEM